jgi:hypothetical protein
VGLLAAYRSGEETFFDRAGLPSHDIQPLDDEAATTLVTQRFPALVPRVRHRLLDEAQGNPLALVELPLALSGRQQAGLGSLPDVLALNRRLQAAFESRVRGLHTPTCQLLLRASLDGTGSLSSLAVGETSLAALAPAERTGLVHVDEGADRLVFHHPLTRSAVVDLSIVDERLRAHADLAAGLANRPERAASHLAQATVIAPHRRRTRQRRRLADQTAIAVPVTQPSRRSLRQATSADPRPARHSSCRSAAPSPETFQP